MLTLLQKGSNDGLSEGQLQRACTRVCSRQIPSFLCNQTILGRQKQRSGQGRKKETNAPACTVGGSKTIPKTENSRGSSTSLIFKTPEVGTETVRQRDGSYFLWNNKKLKREKGCFVPPCPTLWKVFIPLYEFYQEVPSLQWNLSTTEQSEFNCSVHAFSLPLPWHQVPSVEMLFIWKSPPCSGFLLKAATTAVLTGPGRENLVLQFKKTNSVYPFLRRVCRGKDISKWLGTYGRDDSSSKEKGTSKVPVAAAVGRVSYGADSCIVSIERMLQREEKAQVSI